MRPDFAPGYGVILINWNNSSDTISALESLWSSVPRPLEVVVVDSASHDDSVAKMKSWASSEGISAGEGAGSWLTFIQLHENRGFSGGNNVGLLHLLARPAVTHFLLLNNDAMVERSFFAEMNRALERAPNSGLLTGTIFEHPNRSRVWYAGGHEIPFRALIEHNLVVPPTSDPVETEFISGCAMLISRNVIRKLGMLPEVYFPLYSEDAEYSRRAREAGFQVLYAPKALVYHKVGSTVGAAKTSPYIMRTQVRHRVLYVRRNFRGLERLIALTYLVATKPGKAITEALSGRLKMGWAVFAGTVDGFRHPTS